ncbi:hypothetical protein [Candidatus Binatus sp.]|uniref:hypothetical protein n=1 Tax=Candidatus Binatus sp. TaxID=2811406 RepID=UPI002F93BB43
MGTAFFTAVLLIGRAVLAVVPPTWWSYNGLMWLNLGIELLLAAVILAVPVAVVMALARGSAHERRTRTLAIVMAASVLALVAVLAHATLPFAP